MKTVSFILFLCVLVSSVRGADPTISASTVMRGRLTFLGDGILFKTAKQEERFRFSAQPPGAPGEPVVPGLRALSFEFKEILAVRDGRKKDASIMTFQCEDGAKLTLTVNEPVEAIRIELTFSDGGKTTLWKLVSDIR
jgi:hypothetical protein